MRKLKRLVARYRMKQAGFRNINKALRRRWREYCTANYADGRRRKSKIMKIGRKARA